MRRIFLVAALLAVASPALAEPTRDEVMAGAQRCYGIADNRAWLDCFYGSAQPMRAALGLAPAPAGQVRLVPPAEFAPPPRPAAPRVATAAPPPPKHSRDFFSDLIGLPEPVVTDMPMSDYRFGRDHTFTVTLQDGSVYQQVKSDTVYAAWKKPPSAYLVTIGAVAGNSFAMKVKGEPGIVFKVTRR